MTGSNSRCTRPLASSSPQSMYVAPITASSVSARIDGLSRPPVPSSPRPSRTNDPRLSSRAATSASVLIWTTAARSLASWPSGSVG